MTNTPDADLIRICAEHVANRDAYNADSSGREPEDNPLWQAYVRTFEAISDAKPRTLAGLAAKARATKEEATHPDGTEVPEDETVWAFDLVKDLIRIDDERRQPPGPLPAVLDIGRQIVRISNAYNEADCARLALSRQSPKPLDEARQDRELGERMGILFTRECALADLALSMRARSFGDVAVLLGLAWRALSMVRACEYNEEDYERALKQAEHALLSSISVIIQETGFDIAEVVGVEAQAFIDGANADLGDGL